MLLVILDIRWDSPRKAQIAIYCKYTGGAILTALLAALLYFAYIFLIEMFRELNPNLIQSSGDIRIRDEANFLKVVNTTDGHIFTVPSADGSKWEQVHGATIFGYLTVALILATGYILIKSEFFQNFMDRLLHLFNFNGIGFLGGALSLFSFFTSTWSSFPGLFR